MHEAENASCMFHLALKASAILRQAHTYSGEMQHTPSRETMERILQTHYLHYLPEAPTLSQCVSFLNQVPISRQTRDFLITRLVPVPDLDLKHLECQEGPAQASPLTFLPAWHLLLLNNHCLMSCLLQS